MTKEEKKVYVEFQTLDKYPDMSPSEFRDRLKNNQELSDALDKVQDEFYEQAQVLKKIQIRVAMKQLELKAAIMKGLIKDENEKYTQLKGELNDKS